MVGCGFVGSVPAAFVQQEAFPMVLIDESEPGDSVDLTDGICKTDPLFYL